MIVSDEYGSIHSQIHTITQNNYVSLKTMASNKCKLKAEEKYIQLLTCEYKNKTA